MENNFSFGFAIYFMRKGFIVNTGSNKFRSELVGSRRVVKKIYRYEGEEREREVNTLREYIRSNWSIYGEDQETITSALAEAEEAREKVDPSKSTIYFSRAIDYLLDGTASCIFRRSTTITPEMIDNPNVTELDRIATYFSTGWGFEEPAPEPTPDPEPTPEPEGGAE